MLSLYRRHVRKCRFWTGKSTNGNRRNNTCRCPIWVDGHLEGKRVNKSLETRNWTRANEIVRDWEIADTIRQEPEKAVSIGDACRAFLADTEAQHLSGASLKKYRVLLTNRHKAEERGKFSPSLVEFCDEIGLQFAHQIGLGVLSEFRSRWKDGAISGGKKLERLWAVGRFFSDRGWWTQNFALKLKRPTVRALPTLPFSHEEMARLLGACEKYSDGHGRLGQENSHRLRAFILLARYSGLRISDVASCAVDRLLANRLFLYTQKTGVPVHIPLPQFVMDALNSCPRVSERYWFWTGVGSKDTLAGNWRRTFRRLCVLAGVKGGHPHRFRDTLAVELLLAGLPIEQISVLLGHSSVKITERHYAPWVQARQNQLEAGLIRAWRNDPIAQKELLRNEIGAPEAIGVQMAATQQRHENRKAPN